MVRYFIELAYNGSRYHGWQIQENALTVQQVFQEALGKITGDVSVLKKLKGSLSHVKIAARS